ncbi:MAG: SpoIID/LytB domain-containing protein [Planctomycetota bacterium JB042]
MADPDRATRVLVPLAGLGLLTLFLVVDAELGQPAPAAARERVPDGLARPSPGDGLNLPGPPTVTVRLVGALGRRTRFTCGVDGPYRLVEGAHDEASAGRDALAAGDGLSAATVGAADGRVTLNGVPLARTLTLVPERGATVEVGDRRYRGTLVLEAGDDGRVVASNRVDLEEYVAGVLFAEMPERFETAAHRAQTVSVRTYALARTLSGKGLRDDQGSQVYAGVARETEEGRRIVRSTRGEVLTWEGRVFSAYFHSTCGGRTSSARDVFGPDAPPPISASVECGGCDGTRWSRWRRVLRGEDLARLYHGSFGSTLTARVERTDASGRVLSLEVRDAAGEVIDRPVADRFRNDYNRGRPLDESLLSAWFRLRPGGDGATLAEGRGFGHGVGLCQYGADGLAERGADHRRILATYYPGSRLERAYD